jgi:hypothetical protein
MHIYQRDVLQGLLFPSLVMQEIGDSVRYYRHPFNHTGPSAEAKEAFEDFLHTHGMRLAPFTVEHADYVFNALYVEAKAKNDVAQMQKLGKAYLDQLDVAFNFAEKMSEETFGRQIPQIFLFHANLINADYLDAMLAKLQQRGYTFITMAQALEDEAYTTPDEYVKPYGVSWFHRWRISLGKTNLLREEPDPAKWILEAYQALSN